GINFTSADSGMQGYRSRQFLAEICHAQGRPGEARSHARQVLAECPNYPPAIRLLAETQASSPAASEQPGCCRRVSLTMIVKNEESNLPDCLASVADLVDEVIVVDTGSTDSTKEIARAHGTLVFDF